MNFSDVLQGTLTISLLLTVVKHLSVSVCVWEDLKHLVQTDARTILYKKASWCFCHVTVKKTLKNLNKRVAVYF